LERWRQIVERAVRNGTDISQLVQHFAERAFENKTVSLDTQGARRRALTQMRQAVSREIGRAQKARKAHTDTKTSTLMRPYQGITLTFIPPQRTPKAKKTSPGHVTPLSLEGDTQASRSEPLGQKITHTADLEAYIIGLTKQGQAIDQEMAQIDEVLNRGMVNRDSTVAELSATTQELWRVAQEVAAVLQETLSQEAALSKPLPAPLSEEKTAALQPVVQEPVAAPKDVADPLKNSALAAGQSLLANMQALFKKRGF
jgi:uncharacterized protein (DUF885 family)